MPKLTSLEAQEKPETARKSPAESLEEMREGRQYLKYTFFKLLPEWRAANDIVRGSCRRSISDLLDKYSKRMILKVYSLVGYQFLKYLGLNHNRQLLFSIFVPSVIFYGAY
ncbi:MAG: hypothetical protein JRN15_20245, partial [Nitrososphaerota archaeon]|nr:hypothetical protein [Nitrososphaerota archaeon]